ncbi:MAG: cycloartenol synthase [Verrucomicrobiota bacterium]
MKHNLLLLACLPACCLVLAPAAGLRAAEGLRQPTVGRTSDLSLRHEVQRSIDRGLEFLLASQNTNGWWSTADHPAVTALALTAFMGEPTGRHRTNPPAPVRRGYEYLAASARPDGSIYRTAMINYNTAMSAMALLAAGRPEYTPALRRARAFLVQSQVDLDTPGQVDLPYDGGVGYGDKYRHSDMNNTVVALEAIHQLRFLAADQPPGTPDLNWEAALQFIANCQHLPGRNRQEWVSDDPAEFGGFVYHPGESKAGARTNATTGRVSLRSSGSISYAGLLSYLYAQVDRDDPRVKAVLEWLRSNYTLEENPGLRQQGYYYYLHLMAKALTAAQVDQLTLRDGRAVDWRREVALRLLNLQQRDGSWSNAEARWWEKDPHLVTAYSLITLEILHRGM